jgi:hypothetical protein
MEYASQLAELESSATHPLRRRYPRYRLHSLAYVKLDQSNGGVIRDITESGIAIQAVARLQPGTQLRLSFDLLTPRVRVDTIGRIAWADASGQAGIEFSGLTLRTQRALRDWLLAQMFSAAAISGRDSIFESLEPQLITSAVSRPAIVMAPLEAITLDLPRVRWAGVSLSANAFSHFIDALVLLCAVLLFSISSIAVMGGMPAWPVATALFVTAFLIFVSVYQLLFSEWFCGATPGQRLATLASTRPAQDELQPRFR